MAQHSPPNYELFHETSESENGRGRSATASECGRRGFVVVCEPAGLVPPPCPGCAARPRVARGRGAPRQSLFWGSIKADHAADEKATSTFLFQVYAPQTKILGRPAGAPPACRRPRTSTAMRQRRAQSWPLRGARAQLTAGRSIGSRPGRGRANLKVRGPRCATRLPWGLAVCTPAALSGSSSAFASCYQGTVRPADQSP